MRKSVDVSTRIDGTAPANGEPASPSSCIRIDGRVRRSRGSLERHTAQSQPMAGTPCDVPLPRTVTFMEIAGRGPPRLRLDDELLAGAALRRLDKAHAEFVEDLLQQLPLFSGEIAARFFFEQPEDFDHLSGAFEVGFN